VAPTDDEAQPERIRHLYARLAPKYDRSMRLWDRLLFAEPRRWVCSQAAGDTLEVGIGTGLNLLLYPAEIRLTGLDLTPAMLEHARRRAEELGRDVDLREGDAGQMPFPDAAFDTVVFSLSLCTIPDPGRAVDEAHRVLRPGGRLLLVEHVRSPHRAVRAGQRLIDPIAVRFQADHQLREPLEDVHRLGFVVEELRRSGLGIVEALRAAKPAP